MAEAGARAEQEQRLLKALADADDVKLAEELGHRRRLQPHLPLRRRHKRQRVAGELACHAVVQGDHWQSGMRLAARHANSEKYHATGWRRTVPSVTRQPIGSYSWRSRRTSA